jgi:hypothetical protein
MILMINLSDFNKNIKINLETGEKSPRFDGDFEFYSLNMERFQKIQEGMNKLRGDADDLEVSHTLLPYICSINVDESVEVFNEMNEIAPCSEFIDFMLALTDYIRTLFEQIDKMKSMENKINKMKEDYPIISTPIETNEEKIIRVTNEMNNEKDTKLKKVLLLQLAKLYEEAERNEINE